MFSCFSEVFFAGDVLESLKPLMPGTIRRVGHSFTLNNVKPTQCIPTDQSLSNGTKLEAVTRGA
jgi:hypothetical protein